MQYDDPSLLLDLAQAGRLILQFTDGYDYGSFKEDAKTQSAVLHQLLVIGEAAKKLSDEFKGMHPSIPWDDIARMRDKLIHHYRGVDNREVWRIAEKDLPDLLAFLEAFLPPEPS